MTGRIELFSKCIKRHLRSKAFGASGPCAALSEFSVKFTKVEKY